MCAASCRFSALPKLRRRVHATPAVAAVLLDCVVGVRAHRAQNVEAILIGVVATARALGLSREALLERLGTLWKP